MIWPAMFSFGIPSNQTTVTPNTQLTVSDNKADQTEMENDHITIWLGKKADVKNYYLFPKQMWKGFVSWTETVKFHQTDNM